MRIAHLSDPHFQAWPRDWTALLDKRVLGLLNALLFRRRRLHYDRVSRAVERILALAPDLVLVTGDLTSIGDPGEFARARHIFAPLLRPGQPPCLFIPGNHDRYVSCPAARQAFAETFTAFNHGRWNADEPVGQLSFGNVRLFLLNQALPTLPWMSSGRLPAAAAARLQAWLAEPRAPGEKRLAVGHFPCRDARGHRLSRRRRLHPDDQWLHAALGDGRLDFALCGHIHTPFLRSYPNRASEICAGAIAMRGQINMLDISPRTGLCHQHWEDVDGEGDTLIPVPVTAPLPVG